MSIGRTTQSKPPWFKRPWTYVSLLVSAGFTAGLFYYLSRHTTLDDWIGLYQGLNLYLFAAFMGLYLTSMLLKALRYQIFLKSSSTNQTPGLVDLITLTFVSNLFVDLLPARSGSLAYIVFLNRKLKVELPACFSSFAFSFIFDLIGMLPLFLVAIIMHSAAGDKPDWRLWLLLALLAIVSLGVLYFMDRILAWFGKYLVQLTKDRQGRAAQALVRLAQELQRIAGDVTLVKSRGVYGQVLVLSIIIRACKYIGLYLLVIGLAGQFGPVVLGKLGFTVVLFALIAAEATASLPVSGIAGFGAYEGVMMATLSAAGLGPQQAALLPFGLHLLTQTIDYTLGSLCLFRLSLINKEQPKTVSKG